MEGGKRPPPFPPSSLLPSLCCRTASLIPVYASLLSTGVKHPCFRCALVDFTRANQSGRFTSRARVELAGTTSRVTEGEEVCGSAVREAPRSTPSQHRLPLDFSFLALVFVLQPQHFFQFSQQPPSKLATPGPLGCQQRRAADSRSAERQPFSLFPATVLLSKPQPSPSGTQSTCQQR
jgi:hypothetical protein